MVLPISQIGDVAAFARRKGDAWFLAVDNGPVGKAVRVNLAFLGEGSYHSTLLRDQPEADDIKVEHASLRSSDALSIKLRSGGGFVGWFTRSGAAGQIQAPHRAAWMQEAQWGVMTHYLADWQARVHKLNMSVEEWNRLIDGFDVETLAKQLESAGAHYYQITLGQNSGYYLAPNAAYDKLTGVQPSKCSRRDLVTDLHSALGKRGIRLMVYLPSGAPAGDKAAAAALQWRNGPYPNREFQVNWEQVIREWSLRWGKKIAGWWFDGCYFPNSMYRASEPPNFASFAAAARAGNPEAVLAFNPGVVYRMLSITPFEDFTAGEIDKPELTTIRRASNGQIDGAQIQMLSYLGQTWGMGAPRFNEEQVIAHTRKIREAGGAVTWDVPVELNGTISQPFLDQLTALGKALGTLPAGGR